MGGGRSGVTRHVNWINPSSTQGGPTDAVKNRVIKRRANGV